MNITSLFTGDNVQDFQLEEPVQADYSGRPSSSSSSFPSISAGSPECSSFLLNMAASNASCAPDAASFLELPTQQQAAAIQSSPTHFQPLHIRNQPYSRLRDTQFPSPTVNVDDAMMRAMLAVLSSSSPSSSTSAVDPSPQTTRRNLPQSASSRRAKAFNPYNASLAPRLASRRSSGSQSMIKTIHSMLRSIGEMKVETMMQEASKPASSQLHHMISERKRREKLNESFQALRSLLPPATKKDKASVLASTKDCLTSLKAQISDLEEKNRALELRLSPAEEVGEGPGVLPDGVRIQIIKASQSMMSEMQLVDLKMTMGVGCCDIVDLILNMLECLKGMGNISLVAIDANCRSQQIRRANLTLQIKGTEWDEVAFKEAIERALDEVAPSKSTSRAP